MGEVETEGGIVILKRIHVRYHLETPESAPPTGERVHALHAQGCPVHLSLQGAITILTEYRLGAR